MPSQFTALPAPAANGSGAAVDVSTYGANKTFIVSGAWVLEPTVTVEFNNAAISTDGSWQAIKSFQGAGKITVDLACKWVRVSVANFRGGMAPVVNLGGTDDGTTLVNLPVPAGNGAGAAVDVSAMGEFKTAQVSLPFRGSLIIEISTDGGATFGQQFAFGQQGAQSAVFNADFMRVTRNGVPLVRPGMPEVNIAACAVTGGGGGGGGVELENAGVPLAGGPFTTLNLVGATAVDDGGGTATITTLSSTVQSFQYTVTGLEPDLTELVIALPVARPNALYQVQASWANWTALTQIGVDNASRTVAQFVLSLAAPASAGDIFSFTVSEPS